jgi:hypothetical protein
MLRLSIGRASLFLFLVACGAWFFVASPRFLRSGTRQPCSDSEARAFTLFFSWNGQLVGLQIKDLRSDNTVVPPSLRDVISREATEKAKSLGLETGLGSFRAKISLSLRGCSEPYLVSWFDPEIPELSRFMTAAELRDIDEVKDILGTGMNPNARDFQQHTALMYAVVDPSKELSKHPNVLTRPNYKPDLNVVKLLLEAGSDPNYQDTFGVAPLDLADADSAALLLDAHADVNARDHQGHTPLMSAARKGDTRKTALLLAKGASVNLQDDSGNSALIYAVMAGSAQEVHLLVAKQADGSLRNRVGASALTLALGQAKYDSRFRRIVNLLRRN